MLLLVNNQAARVQVFHDSPSFRFPNDAQSHVVKIYSHIDFGYRRLCIIHLCLMTFARVCLSHDAE